MSNSPMGPCFEIIALNITAHHSNDFNLLVEPLEDLKPWCLVLNHIKKIFLQNNKLGSGGTVCLVFFENPVALKR